MRILDAQVLRLDHVQRICHHVSDQELSITELAAFASYDAQISLLLATERSCLH